MRASRSARVTCDSKTTRARQELETAVKLDPNEPTAHYNLALLYARTKEPAKAQEHMRIVETLKTGRRSTSGVVVLPPAQLRIFSK